MEIVTAKNLVEELNLVLARFVKQGNQSAVGVSVTVDDAAITFRRYYAAKHSLSIMASDEARIWAHFHGFVTDRPATLPRVGDRVAFRRGMFGWWTGTVVRVGAHKLTHRHRPGRAFVVVKYRRVNGTTGQQPCETYEIQFK